jgi:uncharacterized protein (TIGR00725 family)
MAAAARGAAGEGGVVVGILPGYDAAAANPWIGIALPTGLGHARNVLVVAGGDAVIALPGADGTRSEVAMARVLSRPVVSLEGVRGEGRGQVQTLSPAEAVERAVGFAKASRSHGAG